MSETLSETRIIAGGGIVTTTVLDEVTPERLALYLVKGTYTAKYAGTVDNTPAISRSIRDLIVSPFEEVTS